MMTPVMDGTGSSSSLRLGDLFKTCDTKGKGVIGKPEFRELCDKFGISPVDSDAIFSDLDHDGDFLIDFEDFSYGFRDFLTPGSRRGSLQILNFESKDNLIQLEEMERKHKTAKNAWKHFTTNVGITNVQPFVGDTGQQIYNIVEEIRTENGEAVSNKLEKALSALILDVQTLHDEYKTLETSFRKEKEIHAAQLAALGEELDHQLAKTEAKAKAEARQEAQKQMDSERKKIATEMESQMADLAAQLRTFQKVEEWLTEEEKRSRNGPSTGDNSKLYEAESENRNLKSALVEAQIKATLLQTQLSQKRNEYQELVNEFHSEKVAASEYKNQVDLMQNHLSILSQANRVLSDANDCFSMAIPSSSPKSCSLQAERMNSLPCSSNTSPKNGIDGLHRVYSDNFIKYESSPFESSRLQPSSQDTDRDSGRGTLLEELQAEGDGSPLPSGLWPLEDPALFFSKGNSNGGNGCHLGMGEERKTIKNNKENSISSTYKSFDEVGQELLPPNRTFKVILAGDAAVGKTTFIERVCQGHFTPNLSSTIGVDFRVKTVELDGKAVALQLWDTAGQERFRSLTKSYFRRADGVILMYDCTQENTFLSIRHWIQNVEEGAGRKVPVVLCGNKSDLRKEGKTHVTSEDGAKLASLCGALFTETSPKTGANVLEALVILAKEMSLVEDLEVKNSVQLNEDDGKKKRTCCGGSSSASNESKSNRN